MNKNQYLNMQEKVYDEIDNILKSKIIKVMTYEVIEKGVLDVPSREVIKDKRYTANLNSWIEEIMFGLNEIVENM